MSDGGAATRALASQLTQGAPDAAGGVAGAADKMQPEDFAQFLCFMTTYMRSVEHARPDRVISDEFAEPLTRQVAPKLAPRVRKWAQNHPQPESLVALRGRYLEEALAQRAPEITQVVILGAGLDTRAYQLETLRGCHVFEIDQCAELFAHKKAVLCGLDASLVAAKYDCIVADLNAFNWEESLLSSGFDPRLPTFWVMEELLMYLSKASNVALLRTLDVLSAPGSEIWGDVVGSVLLEDSELGLLKDVNELSKTELGRGLVLHGEDDAMTGVFAELSGWELELQASLGVAGEHFGRDWTPLRTAVTHTAIPCALLHSRKPMDV